MENILLIIVGLFMVGMIVLGLRKGMVRMAFSLVSVFVVLILINILTPPTKALLKETPIYTNIKTNIQEYVDKNVAEATENITQAGAGAQQKIIDNLPLPKEVKKQLNQNNNEKSYESLKVSSFSDYMAEALADMVINAVTFVILFIIITILVKILIRLLDIITKLPVLHGVNSLGGGIIGLVESVIVLWLLCILVTAFSATDWGQNLCKAIASNGFLSLIYDNNPIQHLITGIFSV